jgi:hypothetical protein
MVGTIVVVSGKATLVGTIVVVSVKATLVGTSVVVSGKATLVGTIVVVSGKATLVGTSVVVLLTGVVFPSFWIHRTSKKTINMMTSITTIILNADIFSFYKKQNNIFCFQDISILIFAMNT